MGRLESESEASRGRTDAEARIVTNEMQMSRRTKCHAIPKTILIVKIMDAKHAKGAKAGQVFSWSASDWNFLQEIHALDIDYFAGSILFQIWMRKNGTAEQQQEYLASLNVGFRR